MLAGEADTASVIEAENYLTIRDDDALLLRRRHGLWQTRELVEVTAEARWIQEGAVYEGECGLWTSEEAHEGEYRYWMAQK
jgi:hypothetical protein